MDKRVVLLIICIAGLACVLGLLGGAYYIVFSTYADGGRVLQVMSGSMKPTLNVTDMVLVRPVSSVSDIVAAYETGDIICFHKPSDPAVLIVHRAVEKIGDTLRTKGDNNEHADFWIVTNDELVGKVVEVNSLPLVILPNTFPLIGISVALIVAIVVLSVSIVSRRKDAVHTPEAKPAVRMQAHLFCRYCGAENKGDAVFCDKCGKKIA